MLSDRIDSLCKQRGISGYRLCKDIGISPNTLTELRGGRRHGVSAETANKIAKYFGVTVDDLLQNDHVNASAAILTPAKQRLLDMIDGLEEEQIDKLLGIISEIKKLCN